MSPHQAQGGCYHSTQAAKERLGAASPVGFCKLLLLPRTHDESAPRRRELHLEEGSTVDLRFTQQAVYDGLKAVFNMKG